MEVIHKLNARWWFRILIFTILSNSLIIPILYFSNTIKDELDFSYSNSIIIELIILIVLGGMSVLIEILRKNGKWYTIGILPDKWAVKDIGLGAIINLLIAFCIFMFATFYSAFSDYYQPPGFDVIFYITMIIMIQAIIEELIFRGIIFQAVLDRFGIIIAILLNSFLFGLGHLANPGINFFAIINIMIAGIVISGMYIKTKSLWLPISFHFFWNWFSAIIGSPVSGIDFQIGLTNIAWNELPSWIFGGSFGIEGGFFATLLLIISGFVTIKLSNVSPYLASILYDRCYYESQLLFKINIKKLNLNN